MILELGYKLVSLLPCGAGRNVSSDINNPLDKKAVLDPKHMLQGVACDELVDAERKPETILTSTGESPKVAPGFHRLAEEFQDILLKEQRLGIPSGMPVLVSPPKI